MQRAGALVGVALFLVMSHATPSRANVCAFDAAPAATLLFPFVAVDLHDTLAGIETMLSVTNVSAQTHVVKVTVWSDFGAPMISFNVVLTGYDTETLDVREMLVQGRLPVTLVGPHSYLEGVRDDGPVSSRSEANGGWIEEVMPQPEPTTDLGNRCPIQADGYPGRYTTPIPESLLGPLQEWLMSSQVQPRSHSSTCEKPFAEAPGGGTWFTDRGPFSLTWVYVTLDVVERCDTRGPLDEGYWAPVQHGGSLRSDNVLIGQMIWRSSAGAAAAAAVHLEADRDLWRVVTPTAAGTPTSFYHHLSAARGLPSDGREPLPTAWGLRYFAGVDGGLRSTVRAWKGPTTQPFLADLEVVPDVESPAALLASNCLAYTVYVWDDDENVVVDFWMPPSETARNLLPLVTQEVSVDAFHLPGESGWMMFIWPPSNFAAAEAPPVDAYQTWMGVAHDAWGTHSCFAHGSPLGNANCFAEQVLPDLGVDYDYVTRRGYRTGSGPLQPQTTSDQ